MSGGATKYPPLREGEIDALVIACGLAAVEHDGEWPDAPVTLPVRRVASLINEVREARDASVRHQEIRDEWESVSEHLRGMRELYREAYARLEAAERVIALQVQSLAELREERDRLLREGSNAA